MTGGFLHCDLIAEFSVLTVKLASGNHSGKQMIGPHGKMYRVFPDLARFSGDMPEQ